ncbi:MAG: DEAD/DEAH box helicase [Cephaloticoccus sp.]|nr:DEAD/DEAH box helicase [Cephaloticoccus sp.]
MPFSELGLSSHLLRALAERDHVEPTLVQAATVPHALSGADIWARAQTGSGKTAGFVLPILQRLQLAVSAKTAVGMALILVPTRELAAQVSESFRSYGRYLPEHARIVTVVGGVSINPQMLALRGGADVVIATPGRLLDLATQNAINLSMVSTLVLDEADRLLELGFADELGRIMALLPDQRQSMLFSATFPSAVDALAGKLLRNPVRIELGAIEETLPDIHERAIEVDAPQRTQLLLHLIHEHQWSRVLVFVATKYATEHVAEKLRRAGVLAGALHGEHSQGGRTRVLADFKASKLQVLVATDLAARGLDIALLPTVVNYDLPRSVIDYTHRIGRTARAGASGVAVSFVSVATHAHFRLIEKRHQRVITREQIEGFEPLATPGPEASLGGGVKGKRKSKKDKLRDAAAGVVCPAPVMQSVPANAFRWHRAAPNQRRRQG